MDLTANTYIFWNREVAESGHCGEKATKTAGGSVINLVNKPDGSAAEGAPAGKDPEH